MIFVELLSLPVVLDLVLHLGLCRPRNLRLVPLAQRARDRPKVTAGLQKRALGLLRPFLLVSGGGAGMGRRKDGEGGWRRRMAKDTGTERMQEAQGRVGMSTAVCTTCTLVAINNNPKLRCPRLTRSAPRHHPLPAKQTRGKSSTTARARTL